MVFDLIFKLPFWFLKCFNYFLIVISIFSDELDQLVHITENYFELTGFPIGVLLSH